MPQGKPLTAQRPARANWITDDMLERYKTHSARETCEHFEIEFTGALQAQLSDAWPKQTKIRISDKMRDYYLGGATWRQVASRYRQEQTGPFRRALLSAAGAKKGKGQYERKLTPITDEMIEYYRNYTFLETCQKFKLKLSKGLQNRFAKLGKQNM